MKYLEQFRQHPITDKLSRIGATALLAIALHSARDAHAQDPDDYPNPQEVAEVIAPEHEAKPVVGKRSAIAVTDARLRDEPTTASSVVGSLKVGQQAEIIDEVADGELLNLRGIKSDVWYEVQWHEQSAFVWSGLVEVETLEAETTTDETETSPMTAEVDPPLANTLSETINDPNTTTLPSEVDMSIMQALREVNNISPTTEDTTEEAANMAFGGVELEALPTETWQLEGEGVDLAGGQTTAYFVETTVQPEQRITIEGQVVPFGVLEDFEVPDFMWDYYHTLTEDGVSVEDHVFFVSGIFVPYRAGTFDFLIPSSADSKQWSAAQTSIIPVFTAIRISPEGELLEDTNVRFERATQITATSIRLHEGDTLRSGQQIILAVSSKTSDAGRRANGGREVLEAFQSGTGAMITRSYTIFYQPR